MSDGKSAAQATEPRGDVRQLGGAKPLARAVGVADDERVPIRQFLEAYRAGASAIVTLVRPPSTRRAGGDGERALITPACQWAQNASVVAVSVRYSPKKHGPVSVANVDEPRVSLNATHVEFDALARGKPLHFAWELELAARIVPEQSEWSTGSPGRLTLTLAKEVPRQSSSPHSEGSGPPLPPTLPPLPLTAAAGRC